MKIKILMVVILFLSACNEVKQAPLDTQGLTPEQVMFKIFVLITKGYYEEAETHYSKQYINEFMTKKNISFKEYHENSRGIDTRGWLQQTLRTEPVGNNYNKDVWRVNLNVDEGKGKSNPVGVVHDFYLINGFWKVVFWGDYPRT